MTLDNVDGRGGQRPLGIHGLYTNLKALSTATNVIRHLARV
jgi:hypothetical protein